MAGTDRDGCRAQRGPGRLRGQDLDLSGPTSDDAHELSLSPAAENHGAVVGGPAGVAEKAGEHFLIGHPHLQIVLATDGYEVQAPALVNELAERNVDAVVLGMGIPAQEKTAMSLRENGWSGITATCGGFFDQIVAGRAYYPDWVDRFNIRFMYRLYKEPRRLWKRYLVHYWPFVLGFAGAFLTGCRASGGVEGDSRR